MRKTVIIIFVILVVSLSYLWLGGGQNLEYKVERLSEFYIVGKEYSGSYNSSKLEELFFSMKTEALKKSSSLVVVNYESDTLDNGKIHQFIGYKSEDVPHEENALQLLKIEAGEYVATEIESHNFVMPKPEDVREGASEHVAAQGVILDSVSIEIYRGERELQILFPINR